jgi:protoheme IX farnesyltransferase
VSATHKVVPQAIGAAEERVSRAAAYYELTKPGIAGFVMVTAGVSYYLGGGGQVDLLPVLHTLLGTVVATAGALALNQYVEREIDALMERTRRRPLPSGRLVPREAFLFGTALVVGGVVYLVLSVGWLPGLLTAIAALAYNMVYTPLKTRSPLATPAGAIPGALPTLIGWTAATGRLSAGAIALFATLFVWQMPHVLSLGWLLREDYARARIQLLPPSDPGGKRIARQMLLHSTALLAVSLVLRVLGLTGNIYLVGVSLTGLLLVAASATAVRALTRSTARHVFLGSLVYHPLFLLFILLDTVRL